MTDLLDRPPSQTHLANSLIYFLVVGDLSTKKLEYEKMFIRIVALLRITSGFQSYF